MGNAKEKFGLKSRDANFWRTFNESKVECYLCPRHCKMGEGVSGFCQVRMNEGGKLKTLNYGVSVEMTQEFIETEAVNHFNPGASILSLGNIGCMMSCDFCHNWQTSQVKHLNKKDLHYYTPEEVVESALNRGVGMLSWTYNDPVVWQEFVVDTARLARKHGIKNLYKSAFYIGPEAIEELCEVIDIFSLSLKSMDPDFYTKIAKARLQPVLDGIVQVYKHGGKHLELSNLLVTGRNDNLEEVTKCVDWMLKNLDENVPLHLVRFHPDFEYTGVERTSIPLLIQAREHALKMGLKHVYLGNVYQETEGLHTRCKGCNEYLVKRFGLNVDSSGLNSEGNCVKCGTKSAVRMEKLKERKEVIVPTSLPAQSSQFLWEGDINACHIVVKNQAKTTADLFIESLDPVRSTFTKITLKAGESWRMISSRSTGQERGVKIYSTKEQTVEFLKVLDRAHFPTGDDRSAENTSAE